MPKTVELRQDRSLIRSNFDGYKLSLDTVPILRQDLSAPPLRTEANDEQYSLLHAELFSMQNHLQVDPWARTQSYFINRLGELIRCCYDENKGRPDAMQVVARLAQLHSRLPHFNIQPRKGDYNYTFRFLSEKYCLLCDGKKSLVLFDTGDRQKANEWSIVATTAIEGETLDPQEVNYVIYDARLDIIKEQKQISLALGHVQRVEAQSLGGSTTHFLYLHWAKWALVEQQWQFSILDTLEGKGSLYYCAFEPRGESLIVSSNRELKWRSQKAKEQEVTAVADTTAEEKPQLHDAAAHDEKIHAYSWTQSDDDVVIKFPIKVGKDKNDYHVKCVANNLTVKCNEELLLEQNLSEKIDHDLTTWTIENNFLQITLVKETTGLPWSSLLANDLGPKESKEEGQASSLPLDQQPIANLEAPIEDCDFPMGTEEDDIFISRFNLASHQITHSVLMGATPPLFTTSLRPGFPAAIATRQDVDASLWLQAYNPLKPDEWSLRHEGNLHAFGYVQASKQQKKFMDCSPDLGYALISESHRHIFLYKSKYDTANGLRNRSGPQITIGKQHLIALEDAGEVLGLSTANCVATLLTEKCVLFLQMEGE